MIRRIVLSTVSLLAVASASFAADLPNRKAPPAVPYFAAPIFTWSGFYVGANIAAVWESDKARVYSFPGAVYQGSARLNGGGMLGGLFAGYNWQMGNSFVIGAEGDINASTVSARTARFTNAAGVTSTLNGYFDEKLPWEGALRARLGYAMGNTLLYVAGGLAFAQVNTRYVDLTPGPVTKFSGTQTGWTLGAGVEYAVNTNWTMRAEYRYVQFNGSKDTIGATGGIFANATAKHQVTENQARFGIAYKFGSPASSVVAKY